MCGNFLNIVDLFRLFGQFIYVTLRGEGEVIVSALNRWYLILLLMALRAGNLTISLLSPSKMLELCLRS